MNYPTLLQQAEDFRSAFSVPSGTTHRAKQKCLIDEEWSEFHEAYHHQTQEQKLKELCDLVYVCYQYAANEGWNLDEAMHRVHQSNMSKLDDNGQPVLRADGKVLKSANYKPPILTDLL